MFREHFAGVVYREHIWTGPWMVVFLRAIKFISSMKLHFIIFYLMSFMSVLLHLAYISSHAHFQSFRMLCQLFMLVRVSLFLFLSNDQWRKSVLRSGGGGMIAIWRWDFSREHAHTYRDTLHHTHTHARTHACTHTHTHTHIHIIFRTF